MLLAFDPASADTLTLVSNGAGAAFLGDTQDGLIDGVPGRVARLQWLSGTPAATQYAGPSVVFSGSPRQIRVVALLGATLPVGLRVVARLYATSTTATLVGEIDRQLASIPYGGVGAWFVWPDTVGAAQRLDLALYNDVAGAPALAAGQIFEIGELAAFRAVDIGIESEWTEAVVDPTETETTRDSSIFSTIRQPYRQIEGALSADRREQVYGAGLAGGWSWRSLQEQLTRDRRCACMTRWREGSTIDHDLVDQTAAYGVARISEIKHYGGDVFGGSFALRQLPAAG